jgi:AraC-like DNA-binding protein
MSFLYRTAPASLALSVRGFWAFCRHPGEGPREEERIVPDGCTEIVAHFGDALKSASGSSPWRNPAPFSRARSAPRCGAVDATDACVAAIGAAGGAIDLAQLATRASLSTRQMQRRFLADVGMGPKLLARVVRFQRVFERCQAGGDWAGIALSCGYFDQSHLLRDFRQFAGEPPVAFFQAAASRASYLGPALISGDPR